VLSVRVRNKGLVIIFLDWLFSLVLVQYGLATVGLTV
jgi:hypothetical protein